MRDRICYLGDDDLSGAAVYLAGVLGHHQLPFDHVPSTVRLSDNCIDDPYRLYIFSDYPGANLTVQQMEGIVAAVAEQGAGLLMIGGWESFYGRVGEYANSPIAGVLPVFLQSQDDRCNCWRPCVVEKTAAHPIVDNLPFDESPVIGGFNRTTAKPNTKTILKAVVFRAIARGERFTFVRSDEAPLLVLGRFGAGRTAAFTTDAAPHWVGGLVDWGNRRIVRQVEDAYVEVGDRYARLLANIVEWTGRWNDWPDALEDDETEIPAEEPNELML
ncbi:hypothetical protein JCM19992_06210 [Thermostilla marina]